MAEEHLAQAVAQEVEPIVWLPIAEAARRLGVTQQAIRSRIERGTLETRREVRGNKTRTLVGLEQAVAQGAAEVAQQLEERLRNALTQQVDQAIAQQVEVLVEQRLADKDQHIADLRSENARLRAELERRRWPGLKARWRRFWEGEG